MLARGKHIYTQPQSVEQLRTPAGGTHFPQALSFRSFKATRRVCPQARHAGSSITALSVNICFDNFSE
ncbi:hypothetical protein C8Q73DRAFT_835687 [Cubamyces lactineus]|nr:hypothetical protein C8Q73DRAFT_835687 [Cubamyces lactineus]